jgi:hypothetical protein
MTNQVVSEIRGPEIFLFVCTAEQTWPNKKKTGRMATVLFYQGSFTHCVFFLV